jgi:uracil-DNA glycosylase
MAIPSQFQAMIKAADVSWHPALLEGLQALDREQPAYLSTLLESEFLPTNGRLFAAFCQPIERVHFVLVGEGPYPRAASATGVCFMDGAVDLLWSPTGLSKAVNRATSLRNFMKMLLVADGRLAPDRTTGNYLAELATSLCAADSSAIHTLSDLQNNLTLNGFLLLNAALVFRAQISPLVEARAWRPFLQVILNTLVHYSNTAQCTLPSLILWGKIAEQIGKVPISHIFPKIIAEHPYNISFIQNQSMHRLFQPMRLLERKCD